MLDMTILLSYQYSYYFNAIQRLFSIYCKVSRGNIKDRITLTNILWEIQQWGKSHNFGKFTTL